VKALGICVNPMSGRDVRRLAGRASNMTHEAKRDIVARIATGADAAGVTDIFVTREPFRIASAALEQISLKARVHIVEHELTNSARDTELSLAAYLDAGCRSFVSLGGDGTNRALVRTLQKKQQEKQQQKQGKAQKAASLDNVVLIPLSTGTNNVYPLLAEPTIAGLVAGLYATQRLPAPDSAESMERGLASRSKVLHLSLPDGSTDIALIDAVLLRNDHVGNLLPFDADKLAQVFLSRAEPEAVGMSPIGGYLEVVGEQHDHGMLVHLGGEQQLNVPVSPGLFAELGVASHQRIPFATPVLFHGPGVLACDGDRDHKLAEGAAARVQLRRDGPWVPNLTDAMRYGTEMGIMAANLRTPL